MYIIRKIQLINAQVTTLDVTVIDNTAVNKDGQGDSTDPDKVVIVNYELVVKAPLLGVNNRPIKNRRAKKNG